MEEHELEAVELLYHYLDGELTDERRALIQRHLDECPPCFEAYDFEAELRIVVQQKCRNRVPESLVSRVADALRSMEEEEAVTVGDGRRPQRPVRPSGTAGVEPAPSSADEPEFGQDFWNGVRGRAQQIRRLQLTEVLSDEAGEGEAFGDDFFAGVERRVDRIGRIRVEELFEQ
jgi:mycothiol system anti-sigma-R factor